LADDFPLLRSLVDRRAGGQKRLPMPGTGDERVPAPLLASVPVGHGPRAGGSASPPAGGAPGTPLEGISSPQPESPIGLPGESPPSGDQVSPDGEALTTGDRSARADIAAAAGTLDTVVGRRR